MEQTPVLVKFSNLQNIMGMLAHALNSGIKPTIEHQTNRVMEVVNEIVTDIPDRKSWRAFTKPQEVFIEPESLHAYMKLNSQVSVFMNATYLNDTVTSKATTKAIEHYLNYIREYYELGPII